MRTVTLIAKGETAVNADAYIDACPGTAVACINDSARLLREGIKPFYCFFSDGFMAGEIVESGRRHVSYTSRVNDSFPEKLYSVNFPVEKWRMCDTGVCGASLEELESELNQGRLCWHHTTPGAIHWLAKYGRYERIRIIGVPFGDEPHVRAKGVAESAAFTKEMNEKHDGNLFHHWNEVTQRVCSLVTRVYGVKVERYEDNHTS